MMTLILPTINISGQCITYSVYGSPNKILTKSQLQQCMLTVFLDSVSIDAVYDEKQNLIRDLLFHDPSLIKIFRTKCSMLAEQNRETLLLCVYVYFSSRDFSIKLLKLLISGRLWHSC